MAFLYWALGSVNFFFGSTGKNPGKTIFPGKRVSVSVFLGILTSSRALISFTSKTKLP